MRSVLIYTAWSLAGVVVAYFALQFFWRAKGSFRVWKARPRPLFGVRHRPWRGPGRGAAPPLPRVAGPWRGRTPRPDGGAGRPVADAGCAVSIHQGTRERIAAMRVGPRRQWAALAGEVGARSPARDTGRPARVGVWLLRGGDPLRL